MILMLNLWILRKPALKYEVKITSSRDFEMNVFNENIPNTNLVLYSKYKLSNSRHIHVKTNIIKNGKKI